MDYIVGGRREYTCARIQKAPHLFSDTLILFFGWECGAPVLKAAAPFLMNL